MLSKLRQETGREEQKEVQRGTNRITEDIKLSSRGIAALRRIERNGERNLKEEKDRRASKSERERERGGGLAKPADDWFRMRDFF